MKLSYINPHNVRCQVPSWAIDPYALAIEVDRLIGEYFVSSGRIQRWSDRLTFWVDCRADDIGWKISIIEADGDDGLDSCGQLIIDSASWSISVPLNELLKGSPSIEHQHCIYMHGIGDGFSSQQKIYVGVTRQRWFDRLSQHRRSAANGSHYLFHRALRDRSNEKHFHRVIVTALEQDSAMALEEEFVDKFGLHPYGYNMIPGGYAGIRYLSTIGVRVSKAVDRDKAIEEMSSRESLDGKHNPLCAARWLSDQQYVNSVICGRQDRLTVDQVRSIRMLIAAGKTTTAVAAIVGDKAQRVSAVAAGKIYSRVA